jgi:hypothetical protein
MDTAMDFFTAYAIGCLYFGGLFQGLSLGSNREIGCRDLFAVGLMGTLWPLTLFAVLIWNLTRKD